MKKILLLLGIVTLLANVSFAQDDKTVTLTVSGQGKTQDEAKQNALRNAIEQAFGTFISSKTEILNDELIADEIVSVSNGNIQAFQLVSELQMPDGRYVTTLNATVSVTKLTSFAASKGIEVEFKGALFAFNVNQQILNEENEIKAIEDLCDVIKTISDESFDFKIDVDDPVSIDSDNTKWKIPLCVSIYINQNMFNLVNYIYSTLEGVSLDKADSENYISLGKEIYPVSFAASADKFDYFILRRQESKLKLLFLLYYFNHSILNFIVSNGLDEFRVQERFDNLTYIYDRFNIFLQHDSNGGWYKRFGVFYVSSTYYHPNKEDYIGGHNVMPVTDYDRSYRPGAIVLDYTIRQKLIEEENNNVKIPRDVYIPKDKPSTSELSYITPEFDFLFDEKMYNLFQKKYQNEYRAGLAISFVGLKLNESIVKIYYDDLRSLEEINKIEGYKVIPGDK